MPTVDYRDIYAMGASSVTGVGMSKGKWPEDDWPVGNPYVPKQTTLGVSHIIKPTKPALDELKYVDEDIAEDCRKAGTWEAGVPSTIQLNRNIEKLLCLMKAQVFLRPVTSKE